MITWHVETSGGARFEYADNEEEMRQQMIEYYNDVCRDPTQDDELAEDTPLDDVIEAIEEYENVSYEEVHDSCIPSPFDARERDTILAALRLWHGVVEGKVYISSSGFSAQLLETLCEIANNDREAENGVPPALGPDEIDALCKRLNS